jgi:hypothetical protein
VRLLYSGEMFGPPRGGETKSKQELTPSRKAAKMKMNQVGDGVVDAAVTIHREPDSKLHRRES